MNEAEQHLPVLAELERLDRADAAVDGRPNWMRVRRLAIFAPCCKEEPLIEVMNTEPPCVLVRQVTYGATDPADTERKPWSGARRGDVGVVWLSTFERMAEQGPPQIVPCRHRRWRVSATDVVNRRGRHVMSEADM
ncbi:hypothetical protein U8D42_03970 [Mycobacterium europaeum]|uniref:hypothetical protein n=1 Tax=Mycobacterium europaeum TaxID=761804 RepID=UPI002ADFDE73|nr:hypothetical protein [Mycobacterium europaeum]MEA1159283.1 hypothetical protein [Mycobacterium europaeum]